MKSAIPSHALEFLQLRRLPGRISADQVAVLLGFQVHDIPVLVAAKLLQPLGNPTQVAHKWFASAEIEAAAKDSKFLAKATRTISQRWRVRNARLPKEQPQFVEQTV